MFSNLKSSAFCLKFSCFVYSYIPTGPWIDQTNLQKLFCDWLRLWIRGSWWSEVGKFLWKISHSQLLGYSPGVWWYNCSWRKVGESLSTACGSESTLPLKAHSLPAQGIQWLLWLVHGKLFSFSLLGFQFNVSFGGWGASSSCHLYTHTRLGWVVASSCLHSSFVLG
jgi:hypothetical protein